MKHVAVVGLGLIGGSLALAVRQRGFSVRATDADRDQLGLAGRAGIDVRVGVRALLEPPAPDILLICTPISAIGSVYREYRRNLTGQPTIFFHTGGLQTPEHLGLTPAAGKGLIGTHPLAGSHESGFRSARADLFDNCIVMMERKASRDELQAGIELWSAAGAGRILVEDAELHDVRMPVVSHLPQLASTALALTIRERGFQARDMGTGGRDSTRLAASPFSFWLELLQRSREDAVSLLARLQWNVGRLRDAIDKEDWRAAERLWNEARSLHEPELDANDDQ